ncbi:MAG TPA: DUF494 family protein [Firmicutes bacterium]|nr:DUF494 family protein [Bacillota bacterium]
MMNERVLEIVNLLIKLILKEEKSPAGEVTLVQDLLSRGYDPAEIDAAFGIIFSAPVEKEGRKTFSSRDILRAPRPQPHRVLNHAERLKLTLEAQGFLEGLTYTGLVQPEELEDVLLYALQLDTDEVGVFEVSWLLEKTVKDPNRLAIITGSEARDQAFFDTRPDTRIVN